VRVIEAATLAAGPMAGAALAEFGALHKARLAAGEGGAGR